LPSRKERIQWEVLPSSTTTQPEDAEAKLRQSSSGW